MVFVKYNAVSKKFETVGADADTVDGKHASDFARNLGTWSSGSVEELALQSSSGFVAISSAVTGMPSDGLAWAATVNGTTKHRQIQAQAFGAPGCIYSKVYDSSTAKWSAWAKVEAGTLDGKSASEFGQNLGLWKDGAIKDKLLAETCSGFVLINSGVTGMPSDGSSWFGVVQRYSDNLKGILVYRFGDGKAFTLVYSGGNWYGWKDTADGGNAAKVGGAALQTSAGTVGLHQMFSGTTAAAKANIPAGAWYGLHS